MFLQRGKWVERRVPMSVGSGTVDGCDGREVVRQADEDLSLCRKLRPSFKGDQ